MPKKKVAPKAVKPAVVVKPVVVAKPAVVKLTMEEKYDKLVDYINAQVDIRNIGGDNFTSKFE